VRDMRAAAAGDSELGTVTDEAQSLLAAPVAESFGRRAIERLALAFAAATLKRRAPAAVSDAFIARRLRSRSMTFGAGDGAIDEAEIIGRIALKG
jgi:putative acyl-CoA dehydrogenase